MAVPAPIDHVRRFGQEDVAKGRVPAVRGAREHEVFAVDLAREEDRVAVKGNEGILHADKGLEVLRAR